MAGEIPWHPDALAMSPLIFAGPTAVGKSAMAVHMASFLGAQIITADKYYLYAGENFLLGLGMTPDELEDGIPRPLLGSLAPEDPVPSTEAYMQMATRAIEAARAAGTVAVAEGCSYSYTMALARHYGYGHVLRLASRAYLVGLPRILERAYDKLVGLGLFEETERALDNGYENTYPMSSIIYGPTIAALRGRVSRREARLQTLNTWAYEAQMTEWRFRETPGLYVATDPASVLMRFTGGQGPSS